jgi:hypothetical protein
MLSSPTTILEVTNALGSPYFDPMNQAHVDAISKYAAALQVKAKNILKAKI